MILSAVLLDTCLNIYIFIISGASRILPAVLKTCTYILNLHLYIKYKYKNYNLKKFPSIC